MNRRHNLSIRNRLLYSVLLVSLLLVLIFLLLAYQDVTEKSNQEFDAQLAREAELILSITQVEIKVGNEESIVPFRTYLEQKLERFAVHEHAHVDGHYDATELMFVVSDMEKNILLHSNETIMELADISQPGFDTIEHEGKDWRVFRIDSEDGALFCVTAESLDLRNELIEVLAMDMIMLFVGLMFVLGLMLWLGIDGCLQPLHKLASQIRSRDAGNLEFVDEQEVPEEIVDVVRSLNRLLVRLRDALARERHTTSDAAHELRTPLAAIKLHAELASNSSDVAEKQQSLQQVVLGVNRATRLVEQLLVLARLDVESYQQRMADNDLNEIVASTVDDLAARAADKKLQLSASYDEHCYIKGESTALKLMLRNLIENAIHYTPGEGTVNVSTRCDSTQVIFCVEDSGPGLSEEEMGKVFQRYYRGGSSEPGCGIGLSIVARVIEMHNATIEMSTPATGQGLQVEVGFLASEHK